MTKVWANGLWNPFTRKKKWRIECGNCQHLWDEKVPVGDHDEMSAICPCCHEQNVWSLSGFTEKYKQQLEERK